MSKKNSNDSFITAILIIYFVIASIFALYFNYLYAKENGFIRWVLFGEVIASFKSIFWPIFIFHIL